MCTEFFNLFDFRNKQVLKYLRVDYSYLNYVIFYTKNSLVDLNTVAGAK